MDVGSALDRDEPPHILPVRRHARRILREHTAHRSDPRLMLDVGSGERPAFRESMPASWRYVSADIEAGDVAASAAQLPFREASFDGSVTFAVWEHLPDPDGSIRDLARVLKPGGVLLLAVPGVFPYHGHAGRYGDYYRWTAEGVHHLVDPLFRVEAVEPFGGVALAIATLCGFYMDAVAARRRLLRPLRFLSRILVEAVDRIDRRLPSFKAGRERYGGISIGYMVIATKR